MTKKDFQALVDWMYIPANYMVKEYCIMAGVTLDDMRDIAEQDDETKRLFELALAIQEVKVAKGALDGDIDRTVALKMLETFHEWKGDASVKNFNQFNKYATDASERARALEEKA